MSVRRHPSAAIVNGTRVEPTRLHAVLAAGIIRNGVAPKAFEVPKGSSATAVRNAPVMAPLSPKMLSNIKALLRHPFLSTSTQAVPVSVKKQVFEITDEDVEALLSELKATLRRRLEKAIEDDYISQDEILEINELVNNGFMKGVQTELDLLAVVDYRLEMAEKTQEYEEYNEDEPEYVSYNNDEPSYVPADEARLRRRRRERLDLQLQKQQHREELESLKRRRMRIYKTLGQLAVFTVAGGAFAQFLASGGAGFDEMEKSLWEKILASVPPPPFALV